MFASGDGKAYARRGRNNHAVMRQPGRWRPKQPIQSILGEMQVEPSDFGTNRAADSSKCTIVKHLRGGDRSHRE